MRNFYYIQEKKEPHMNLRQVVPHPFRIKFKFLAFIYIFTVVVILSYNTPYFSICAQTENLLSPFRTCCVTSLCLFIFDFIENAPHITFSCPPLIFHSLHRMLMLQEHVLFLQVVRSTYSFEGLLCFILWEDPVTWWALILIV